MAELIHETRSTIIARDGKSFRALVVGEQRPDGTWHGWIEFRGARGAVLSTGAETLQISRGALEYWATGLEPSYVEGAFERAETLVVR